MKTHPVTPATRDIELTLHMIKAQTLFHDEELEEELTGHHTHDAT